MKKIFSKINFVYVGIPILLISSSLLFFNFSGEKAVKKVVNKTNIKESACSNLADSSISLFFVGDMMGHQSMIDAAQVKGENKYDYMDWFQFLSPYLENQDYAVANLEVTLGGSPYSGYPQFCSPDSYAEAIQKAGFDFFITANNHSQDKGKKGLERTIDVLDQLHIDHTGTFKNEKERADNYPFIKVIKGKKIAFLNYTYGTNGLEVVAPNIVNRIDTTQIAIDLNKAKKLAADFIVVTLHWGAEYERNYNSSQNKLAQWLCDNGTDAIIGMHPHVVQPMEIMHPKNNSSKNIPVAYSLGNCISSQRDQYKNGGIGVGLNLTISNGKISFTDWSFLPFWVRVRRNPNGFYLIPVSDWEKNPGKYNLSADDIEKIKQFGKDTRSLLNGNKEMN
jgi:poly-gamma-glutamate synthesis protein (capsule biosynthesis protein)